MTSLIDPATGGLRRIHDIATKSFGSDNYSGAHPEILAALATANEGHVTSYGYDPYTEALQEVIHEHFGAQATAYPVFCGTGANVMALAMMTEKWEAVVCSDQAHINTDETGAPEKAAGLKLLAVPTPDARLTPALVDTKAWGFGFEHHAQPAVLSITQSTELGTVYSLEQLRALADHAHGLGMTVHMDGSRLPNAAASLGVSLAELTREVGVDVLSLGASKNGALGAEAVVVLNPEAVRGPLYVRKMVTQLPSKMRFISAQLIAMYGGDLWLRNARAANGMAARLADGVRSLEGVTLTQEPAVNAVFAILPRDVAERLRQRYHFYDWDEATGEVRWMCSYDTTEEDVDGFVAALREELEHSASSRGSAGREGSAGA